LAEDITRQISSISNISIVNREIKEIGENQNPVIIATGPLTSDDFAQFLTTLTQRKNLFFYDATSPIIDAETIDYSKVYQASRYNKGDADFLNIPLNEKQYNDFVCDLIESEKVEIKDFEKGLFFEACLPLEEIAKRGPMSLAFGTLKPVGLMDPHTKKIPHAVVQLRQDDTQKNFFQMIGFQTRLKHSEQKRIFRKLPGLEKAKFERYGRMHRNTYINSPLIVDQFLESKKRENVFFAGQICGVEGYVESVCSGLIAGIYASQKVLNAPLISLPKDTAIGALINYISTANWKNFRPMKFTFGLLPDIKKKKWLEKDQVKNSATKKRKKEIKASIAIDSLYKWKQKIKI
jgi:methylenetetrahydrofolate--tRNA-(uracil-5-)-methyltransferase